MLKIAFLFILAANLHHEAHWQDFLKGHEGECCVFKSNELGTTTNNPIQSLTAMLKEALKNPDNEKFVILSESVIPLQDFDTVYATLLEHEKSMFYFMPNPHANRSTMVPPSTLSMNLKPIPAEEQYLCPQWIVLNGKHAQLIANDATYLPLITQQTKDLSFYPATVLASYGLLGEVQPRDVIFAAWQKNKEKPPYVFDDYNKPRTLKDCGESHDMQLIKTAIDQGFLFFDNVDKNCKNLKLLDRLLPYRNHAENHPDSIDQKTDITPDNHLELMDAKDAIALLS